MTAPAAQAAGEEERKVDIGTSIARAIRAARQAVKACEVLDVFARPTCVQPAICGVRKRKGPDTRCDSCRARDALTNTINPILSGDA